METHYVNYKRNTANKNAGDKKTKKNILMLFPKLAICGKKIDVPYKLKRK